MLPVGGGLDAGAARRAAAVVTLASARLIASGVALAAPVIVALWLTDLALGLVARAAPQVPVYFIGLPLKGLLAIGLVLLCLGTLQAALVGDLGCLDAARRSARHGASELCCAPCREPSASGSCPLCSPSLSPFRQLPRRRWRRGRPRRWRSISSKVVLGSWAKYNTTMGSMPPTAMKMALVNRSPAGHTLEMSVEGGMAAGRASVVTQMTLPLDSSTVEKMVLQVGANDPMEMPVEGPRADSSPSPIRRRW